MRSRSLDEDGAPRPPLLKKLAALGLDESAVSELTREGEGKKEMLFHNHVEPGQTLVDALQAGLPKALAQLPIPKIMTYQLHRGTPLPGWDSVQFVRPAHGLVALHGADVVPVSVLGLPAGRSTQGHRFEASANPVQLADADSYAQTLRESGAVIASFAERRALVHDEVLAAAARAGEGLAIIEDDALLDEVTALVEQPHALVCSFDEEFLQVPPECLILTMKVNQKYFPLRDANGRLSHRFVVVSNIAPQDESAIIEGNERVVRARLADARFFYDQDRKQTLQSRVPALTSVVYHNRLGTQGERSERVAAIARALAAALDEDGDLVRQAEQAARLAKADLLTGMVGEFPELQGTMGRYYALHDGLPEPVANAIADHYRPRFSGDALPRGPVGTVVALADKLETLVGLFGIGSLPTGDKDPFALRRHALGVVRILMEKSLPLALTDDLLIAAASAFEDWLAAQPDVTDAAECFAVHMQLLQEFIAERLAGHLRELGYTAREVAAVMALDPQRLDQVVPRLDAVRAFARLPEAPALAAANKRVANMLKKTEPNTVPDDAGVVDPELLQEPAEQALHEALERLGPQAQDQFDEGNYTESLQTLAALRDPVDAFFDHVMVNAKDQDLRRNRHALLQQLHAAMNQVADLAELA